MKILRGGGRLADLNIVARRELQKSLDARAGMFRALAFVAVRQQQHDAGEQIPLVFARDDELVDDDLRAVGEIAELRFPQNQRFGIIAAEAVFEAEHGGFGESGIVDFEPGLAGRQMLRAERNSSSFSISISAAWRWLNVPRRLSCPLRRTGMPCCSSEPKASASAIPKSIGRLPVRHFGALLEQLFHFGMNVKSVADSWRALAGQRANSAAALPVSTSSDGVVAAAAIGVPVARQLAHRRILLEFFRFFLRGVEILRELFATIGAASTPIFSA